MQEVHCLPLFQRRVSFQPTLRWVSIGSCAVFLRTIRLAGLEPCLELYLYCPAPLSASETNQRLFAHLVDPCVLLLVSKLPLMFLHLAGVASGAVVTRSGTR